MIHLGGKSYVLHAHTSSDCVRRIVVQEDTIVPPRCQKNIMARTIYSDLSQHGNAWITKPTEIAPGLRTARTLVIDRPDNVSVQVINLSNSELQLPKGKSLGELESVEPFSDIEEQKGFSGIADEMTPELEYLRPAIDSADSTMSLESRQRLSSLIVRYADVFSKSEFDLGCAAQGKHRIDTGKERPVRQQLRRQPLQMTSIIDEQLDLMQKQDLITPCQSEWSANIVMVKNKDGTLRFCVDYRQLNEKTLKDAYP